MVNVDERRTPCSLAPKRPLWAIPAARSSGPLGDKTHSPLFVNDWPNAQPLGYHLLKLVEKSSKTCWSCATVAACSLRCFSAASNTLRRVRNDSSDDCSEASVSHTNNGCPAS